MHILGCNIMNSDRNNEGMKNSRGVVTKKYSYKKHNGANQVIFSKHKDVSGLEENR